MVHVEVMNLRRLEPRQPLPQPLRQPVKTRKPQIGTGMATGLQAGQAINGSKELGPGDMVPIGSGPLVTGWVDLFPRDISRALS